jgi:hypothetical protein
MPDAEVSAVSQASGLGQPPPILRKQAGQFLEKATLNSTAWAALQMGVPWPRPPRLCSVQSWACKLIPSHPPQPYWPLGPMQQPQLSGEPLWAFSPASCSSYYTHLPLWLPTIPWVRHCMSEGTQ